MAEEIERVAVPLSEAPVRQDLTDKECAHVLGATINLLAMMTGDLDTVRRALDWWAVNENAWAAIAAQKEMLAKLSESNKSPEDLLASLANLKLG